MTLSLATTNLFLANMTQAGDLECSELCLPGDTTQFKGRFAETLNRLMVRENEPDNTLMVLSDILADTSLDMGSSADILNILNKFFGNFGLNQAEFSESGSLLNYYLAGKGIGPGSTLGADSLAAELAAMQSVARGGSEDILSLLNRLIDNQGLRIGGSVEEAAGLLYNFLFDPGTDTNDTLQAIDGLYQFMAFLSSSIFDGTHDDFIDQFRQYLEEAENACSGISINAQGLEALEDLLVQAGFNADEIAQLITGLQEESNGSEILLSDLMASLSELENETENNTEGSESLFMISAVPYITSVLKTFGIPDTITDELISDAKEEGKGINLDTLITGLQALEKTSFMAGVRFNTDSSDQGFNMMLEQIGVGNASGSNGKMTLGEFIAALEQMRADENYETNARTQGVGSKSQGEITDLVDTVMNNLNKTRESSNLSSAAAGGTGIESNYMEMQQYGPKALDKFFSFQNGQVLPGNPATDNTQTIHPDVARLLGKIEVFADQIKQSVGDVQYDEEITGAVDQKVDKKGTVKGLDQGQSMGGNFRGTDMDGQALDSLKSRMSPRTLPTYVANQVGRNLIRAVNRGNSEIQLQLKPPELGRLFMTIDNLGSSLKVSVIAENQAARDILVSHANELKTALAGSGISIESFEVELGSDFRQSMADARQQFGSSGSGKSGELKDDVSGSESDGSANETGYQENTGALHFVA